MDDCTRCDCVLHSPPGGGGRKLAAASSSTTPRDVLAGYEVRGQVGLPESLAHRRGSMRQTASPPTLFPLVKSMCFSDCGDWKCGRPAHSRMYRIIDMSSVPFVGPRKVLGRAVRAVLETP
eukprot:6741335-Pyramimonas_sp.AAC.1